MKKYIISEDKLLNLLEARHKLTALEFGGVDNWQFYSESLTEYIDDLCEETGEDPDDIWFDELAYNDLKNYEEI